MDTACVTSMIRKAEARDVPRIVQLAWENVWDGPYKRKILFDEDISRLFVSELLADPEAAVLVYDHEGTVEGIFGFTTFPNFYYFKGQRIASMVFWSVSDRFRGRQSIRLLKSGEDEARKLGAKRMILTGPSAEFSSLSKHCGYDYLESSHIKEL
jgi:hypothetical protein